MSDAEGSGLTFIEQLTALGSCSCTESARPLMLATNQVSRRAMLFKPNCKQWKCPTCGAENARRWIARLIYGMNSGDVEQWYFVTFTAHEKWRKNTSLVNLRKNWPKLRKRMRRLGGNDMMYAWVYEPHKDTSWHVHLLSSAKESTRWWKDNARQCGMGHQAKALKAKNAGMVAGYVSKYMLKSLYQAERYPKGMRRITVSANWPSKEYAKGEWEYDSTIKLKAGTDPHAVYKNLKAQGYSVADIQNHRYDPIVE